MQGIEFRLKSNGTCNKEMTSTEPALVNLYEFLDAAAPAVVQVTWPKDPGCILEVRPLSV